MPDNQSRSLLRKYGALTFGLSLIVIVVGLSGLIGLIYNIPFLTRFDPTWEAIKANTSIGLILGAVALIAQMVGTSKNLIKISVFLSFCILLLGALSLSEHIFGVNLGIDEAFVKDIFYRNGFPGRMPILVSFNLCVLGIALLFYQFKNNISLFCSVIILINSLLVTVLYLYGSGASLSLSAHHLTMTLQTSISFTFLSMGIIFSQAEGKLIKYIFMDLPGSKIGRRLIPIAILVPIGLGFLRIVGQHAGLFDANTGLAISTIANLVIIFTIITVNILLLNAEGLINIKSNQALTESNALLQQKMKENEVFGNKLQQDTEHLNEVIKTQALLSNAKLDKNLFYELVLDRIQFLTSARGAVIEMVEKDEMVYSAVSKSFSQHLGLKLKRHDSLSGRCVLKREILICSDTENDERVNVAACRKVGIRSMIVTPLFHRENVVGVLKIMAEKPNFFQSRDMQTLQLMAGLIGSAIQHQDQFTNTQKLLKEKTEAMVNLQKEMEQRKLSEEKLHHSENRIRLIIDSSYDAFIGMNQEGHIIEWNKQAEMIFNQSKDNVLGLDLANIIIPTRFRVAHRHGLKHFLQTGEGPVLNKRIELQALRSTEEEFPVELTITAVKIKESFEFFAFLHDITKRKEAEAKLHYLATHDFLTSLPNRAKFHEHLSQAISHHRNKNSLALIYLDVDHFKSVNDTKGHMFGDELLKEFANRLTNIVLMDGLVSRLGGDEFTIILENTSIKKIEIIAKQILVEMRRPFLLAHESLSITTSIGIALYDGKLTADQFIKSADNALYLAKNAGRNIYKIANH